jgi:hypothetical protein
MGDEGPLIPAFFKGPGEAFLQRYFLCIDDQFIRKINHRGFIKTYRRLWQIFMFRYDFRNRGIALRYKPGCAGPRVTRLGSRNVVKQRPRSDEFPVKRTAPPYQRRGDFFRFTRHRPAMVDHRLGRLFFPQKTKTFRFIRDIRHYANLLNGKIVFLYYLSALLTNE